MDDVLSVVLCMTRILRYLLIIIKVSTGSFSPFVFSLEAKLLTLTTICLSFVFFLELVTV